MRRSFFFPLAIALACAVAWPTAFAKPKVVKVKVRVSSAASGYEAYRAMDGNPRTMWHTEYGSAEPKHPHQIVVDLGAAYPITGFTCVPRSTGGTNGTIKDYEFYVSQNAKKLGKPVVKGAFTKSTSPNTVDLLEGVTGRYVVLRALSEVNGKPWASIAELRILSKGVVFRADSGKSGVVLVEARSEVERQYETLRYDVRNRRRFAQFAPQAYRPEALILESDRDPLDVILRRSAALLTDLKRLPGTPDLAPMAAELKTLQKAAAETEVTDTEARLELFKKAHALRRTIALRNPLLDFGQILFITRRRCEGGHATGNHMCDQYYGRNAFAGGGLYVLDDPLGPEPKVRDVLADAVVERGRLKGQKLEGGSFLAPELSFDGKTILFAYVECKGDKAHRHHTDPSKGHWDQGRCYHVFKVNLDGSGLEQLTDGTWNDFDPCWMPSGRISFISERRGGYLRCGRVCPTYTLYDMAADGSDIRCLSFHETNEWQPSLTHDGRIIYTRWDYIDRHGCVAHLPWVTTPDGRDSRAVHGNFAPRRSRADMELDIRAIPGSYKFVATGAPHHGQSFGSFVLIDPRAIDDDAMEPLKRITPDVGFPESQGGRQVYATAWPLSQDYFLCVYDSAMEVRGLGRPGNYGIYLLDSFGNKVLIHRDPAIACQSPIPVRPRPRPPVIPDMSDRVDAAKPAEATVAVLNVYDSIKPWPEGTAIKSLRVFQIIPMSVPSGGPPHETGLRLPTAGDSVNPARYVLGTVPVEDDGSAHFAVPARKEIFFQALDERGLAVQSMRSATYLQPGERLVCQGCHEPKGRSPQMGMLPPKALLRTPSKLVPDVDGSNPFSYPRLVQPVLERHCVKCHSQNPKKAPRLDRELIAKGRRRFYASYHSLAPKYGFWKYGDGHRTTPGRFGAQASKLYPMLVKGHHDLKLPPEDLHRIALWLDSSSLFYGVYEKEGGAAQLRGEVAMPTLE